MTWPMIPVGDILRTPMRTGMSRRGSADAAHRVVTLGAIRAGRLDPAESKPIDLSSEEARRFTVRPGAFYVVRGNGNLALVGRGGLAPDALPTPITFPDLLIELHPDPAALDVRYLSHAWDSEAVRSQVEDMARTSSGIYKVNLANLARVRIPLPALDEQRRIADWLTDRIAAVDRLRDGLSVEVAELRLLRGRVYEDAFESVVPLSVNRESAQPPDGWIWRLLTDLARLESGHTPSRGHPDWWDGDIGWIQLADIRAVDGRVINETSETTNADGIAHSAARVLPADTVVMSRTASVGFVARMGRPMATSQDFVNWVCGPDLDPVFLLHLLIRSRDYVRALSSGAIHKTVYYPTVKAFRVCVPPVEEQRRIATELSARLEKVDRAGVGLTAQFEVARALPAALLRRAFDEQPLPGLSEHYA
jgi:type I restriction enzyme S subunit